jgi:hypothetical protein
MSDGRKVSGPLDVESIRVVDFGRATVRYPLAGDGPELDQETWTSRCQAELQLAMNMFCAIEL